jgi:hypothetical protein
LIYFVLGRECENTRGQTESEAWYSSLSIKLNSNSCSDNHVTEKDRMSENVMGAVKKKLYEWLKIRPDKKQLIQKKILRGFICLCGSVIMLLLLLTS